MCKEMEDWTFLLFSFSGQIWCGDTTLNASETFVNCWFQVIQLHNDGIKPDYKKGVCL